jgi:hypothetical protein
MLSPVGELRLALIGIGLSGFVGCYYEVAWTRVLALGFGVNDARVFSD